MGIMRSKLFPLIPVVLVLALVLSGSAQAVQLLKNPGFEENDGAPGGPAHHWTNTEEAGIENWAGAAHSGVAGLWQSLPGEAMEPAIFTRM